MLAAAKQEFYLFMIKDFIFKLLSCNAISYRKYPKIDLIEEKNLVFRSSMKEYLLRASSRKKYN